MWVYVARRLLWLPFLLIAVSFITFSLGRFGPGDPVEVMLGNRYEPELADRLRHNLGLDRNFFVQYGDYMWGAVRGDFGDSFRFRDREVGSLLWRKMWVSFQVNAAAMAVSLAVGLPLGFWIAHNQGNWKDPTAVAIALVLMSIPVMVTIPVVLWAGCLKLDLFPCAQWRGFFHPFTLVIGITMGLPGVAAFARLMRASTLDVMGQDFIRTAHAKGLSSLAVDYKHILKNALIPIVTILAFSLSAMFSTSFIVERLLGIPGVGDFAIQAVFNRDYPVIMAITLIGATIMVVAILLSDIAYAFIDPRIRYR